MKKIFLLFFSAIFISMAADAQSYQTDRLTNGYKTFPKNYYGFRIGLSYAHISGNNAPDSDFDHTCGRRSKLNIGFAYGKGLSSSTPLYIETGLYYTAKGGRNKDTDERWDYNLDYLELPLVLKYMYVSGGGFGAHIFFGGYFACGISGSIKNYEYELSHSSFSDQQNAYRRFDAGLKFGLGVSYSFIYLEFAYDLGLANINHNSFYAVHNRSAIFNLGVNF